MARPNVSAVISGPLFVALEFAATDPDSQWLAAADLG